MVDPALPDETPELAAGVPPVLLAALRAYALHRQPLGGFLTAVVCNDFVHAVCHADPANLVALRPIALYIYNALPAPCWGSTEKVEAWLRGAPKQSTLPGPGRD